MLQHIFPYSFSFYVYLLQTYCYMYFFYILFFCIFLLVLPAFRSYVDGIFFLYHFLNDNDFVHILLTFFSSVHSEYFLIIFLNKKKNLKNLFIPCDDPFLAQISNFWQVSNLIFVNSKSNTTIINTIDIENSNIAYVER